MGEEIPAGSQSNSLNNKVNRVSSDNFFLLLEMLPSSVKVKILLGSLPSCFLISV